MGPFGFLDRLRGLDLGKLFEILKVIDLSKLSAVLAAIKTTFDGEPPLDAPGGIETRIKEVVVLAGAITDATKTPEDDKLADALEKLAANDALLALVAGAIRWLMDAGDVEPERLPVVDVQPFLAAGIDPGTITAIIGLLVKLWEIYKAWRGK